MFASQQNQPLDFNRHPGYDERAITQSLEAWEVIEDVRDFVDHPDLLTLSELPDVLHFYVSRAFASYC